METAHDSIVWTLAWHPLGHILCSGSNDHTIKFWTRNRPGDLMRDKYNLNTLPASLAAMDDCEYDDAVIPGMGPEDKVEFTESLTADKGFIPGLDLDPSRIGDRDREKKVPYSKPIPRNFQAQWAGSRRPDESSFHDELAMREPKDTSGLSHQQISESTIEGMLASGVLTTMDPQAIVGLLVYNRFIRVHPDSRVMVAIRQGPDYLNKYIDAGKLDELRDVVPTRDRSRSLSPTLERRESSPPSKRSRFEPRQHSAQLVSVRELLSLKKPFLPCLLQMKSQQASQKPEYVDDVRDSPTPQPQPQQQQSFHQQQQQQQQSPMQQQQSRPSPWAVGPPFQQQQQQQQQPPNPWSTSPMGSGSNGGPNLVSPPNQNGYNGNNGPYNGPNFNDSMNYGDNMFPKGGGGPGPDENNGMHMSNMNMNNMGNNIYGNQRRGNRRGGGGGGGGGVGVGGARNRGGRNNNRRF